LGSLTALVRLVIFEPTRQCQLVTSLVSDLALSADGPMRLYLAQRLGAVIGDNHKRAGHFARLLSK
jgi:hypothetical protein